MKHEFKIIHPYVHSYKVNGLHDFLSLYEEEFDEIFKLHRKGEKDNSAYNVSLEYSTKLYIKLSDILYDIIYNFYLVDQNWNSINLSLYSQVKGDDAPVYHNHYNTGTIASTMYLNPPNKDQGGGLEFMFHGENTTILYPQKDYIYFFPAWALHRPLPQTTNKPRHCLNWGYNCSKRPIHKLTGDRW